MPDFVELNNDQRREVVNTRQRYQAWRAAADREYGFRGSMVWDESGGRRYLLRSFYNETGNRRQKSLGPESPETIEMKARFDRERMFAVNVRRNQDLVIERQAAINRVLGLGRVPTLTARILKLLDKRGLLGKGIRVVGTNALYAYEAACGVLLDPGLTTTEDIDLLLDTRKQLYLLGDPELPDESLLQLLKQADRSFAKTRQSFRARNDDGYMVDLIRPLPTPPWRTGSGRVGNTDDLEAAEIEGLAWLENAPSFEQVAIDDKGFPLRIVAADPRVFAVHKHWVSLQQGRDPVKRARDRAQARTTAALVRHYLPHLPFLPEELRMIPKDVLEAAFADFQTNA